ncbi:TPA: histidine phosphatase family protein [Acinetobacter nosocomialis]|uniref:Histidine phosphatase family protein n=1 Tax=Acinetobacter nosocomialis TaxID=106654 RepID=A0AB36M0I5_ACINO|nr:MULTISPECIES: histidine phosphatase family protein [Acinetobacter calcoaceticus/baumannii complex]MBJ8458990.1 histidine phosphatase family protein [Acinetobacter nosocomialis]OTL96463.1 histidine phosphatase family protein [Acinetobacter nosocomialis]HDG9823934.1 histidine phosphatase family protein [Acinetobacter nosocomialis]HEM6634283.1 histidine phosphatase family protein [Acinetobacter nosocomialis]HEM7377384.1 histidine phosphatase family protein [Acinetobacter nosocomialis]
MGKFRIDLLRHGESQYSHTLRGHLDDELTAKGWQQMQSTIEQVTDQTWDVIVSSSLKRCSCFAEELAKTAELPLLINHDLKEMYFGEWEGISTQQIYETSPKLLANFWQEPSQYCPPRAETLNQFQKRVLKGFQDLVTHMQKHNLQHALVVTHGGVIKLLACLAEQQPLDDLLKMSAELGKLYSFEFSEADGQLTFMLR